MRKFIVALVLMSGVMFVITRFAEIGDIGETLQRGDWRFLSLAALVEAIWIVNLGTSFKAIYRSIGINENLGRLTLMASAANFVNIVAPSAGVGGIAVFIAEARAREYSVGRATVASTLFVLFDYFGFFVILTLGFVVLIRRDKVTIPEVTAAIFLVLIAISLATLLYLGAYSEQKLGRILAWLARLVNRIAKPFRRHSHNAYLSEERAYSFASEITEGLQELKYNPKTLIVPVVLALNGKVLMILVLWCVLLAFEVPVSIGTLIAGFCIANLFVIASPTPSGVGIVEGMLTLALHSFYIPLGASAVIAMVYRACTFWLPLFFGMIAFHRVGQTQNADSE